MKIFIGVDFSTAEFTVSTQVLRNPDAASRSHHGDDFKVSNRPKLINLKNSKFRKSF